MALSFTDPTAEARHIVESMQALRGVAFAEDGVEPGLSWSDMAILLRSFLEQAGLREELVPGGRGKVVFYNLGKFSQVITDFETIQYQSKPVEKYASFADFLEHRAEDACPEGWQDNQYANPDAVRVMTIHQAKGMQWPVVFVPALLRNRFPPKKPGGRNVWHLLPRVEQTLQLSLACCQGTIVG